MTVFALKIIAMVTMVVDHVGYQLMGNVQIMRSIGRVAFIVYAFLIAESYYHLREKPDRLKVHIVKLLLLCVITEVPFDLFDQRALVDMAVQSALPTLLFGFITLVLSGCLTRKLQEHRIAATCGSIVIFLAAAAASYLCRSEYKFAGVLLIGLFYLYLRRADELSLPMRFLALVVVFAIHIPIYIWSRSGFGNWTAFVKAAEVFKPRFAGTVISIIPLALYNRKIGYQSTWFNTVYSLFYPAQFIVLLLIRDVILHI